MTDKIHAVVSSPERLTFERVGKAPKPDRKAEAAAALAVAGVVGDLAQVERQALLRVGPGRRRWSELERFDQELGASEERSARISAELQQLQAARDNDSARLTAALASWLEAGGKGAKPVSRVAELEERIAELRAEEDAQNLLRTRLLEKRAAHVAKHRKRFLADTRKAKQEAERRYLALVDQLQAARQDLLDVRQAEVWAAVYPSETLFSTSPTGMLAGAVRRVQEKALPGIRLGLEAGGILDLLRADAAFCADVATDEQRKLLEGRARPASQRKPPGRRARRGAKRRTQTGEGGVRRTSRSGASQRRSGSARTGKWNGSERRNAMALGRNPEPTPKKPVRQIPSAEAPRKLPRPTRPSTKAKS